MTRSHFSPVVSTYEGRRQRLCTEPAAANAQEERVLVISAVQVRCVQHQRLLVYRGGRFAMKSACVAVQRQPFRQLFLRQFPAYVTLSAASTVSRTE